MSAAAAAAGLPLALADETVAILPATADEEKILKALIAFDTVVLLKISRAFDRVYEMLTQLKLDKSAVFVRRVGSSERRGSRRPGIAGGEEAGLSVAADRKEVNSLHPVHLFIPAAERFPLCPLESTSISSAPDPAIRN